MVKKAPTFWQNLKRVKQCFHTYDFHGVIVASSKVSSYAGIYFLPKIPQLMPYAHHSCQKLCMDHFVMK
jgi:hypothetical protein